MTDEDETSQKKNLDIKGAFSSDDAAHRSALFSPEDMDIYVNKVTHEAYIFHAKDVNYDQIDHLEYDPKEKRVDVVMKDSTRKDLGVKIQWLVRPYFTKAKEISIVQTKDREPVDGTTVPLTHKNTEIEQHVDTKE